MRGSPGIPLSPVSGLIKRDFTAIVLVPTSDDMKILSVFLLLKA
jgi:hypothetical protein